MIFITSSNKNEEKTDRIYLDTFVFMDMLSGQKEAVEKAKKYLQQQAMVSSIVLAELVFHMVRHGVHRAKKDEIIFYIRSLENLKIIDVTDEIAEMAGKIRARYWKLLEKKLTYFDSIHIATAIVAGAKKFVTGDKDFRGIKEIEVEVY